MVQRSGNAVPFGLHKLEMQFQKLVSTLASYLLRGLDIMQCSIQPAICSKGVKQRLLYDGGI